MNILIIYGVALVLLFALAYVTKRRFGVLGLALAAGSMLSGMWSAEITPLVRDAGVDIVAPPLATLVSVALVLLPATVLLFSGPSYRHRNERLIGAFLFASLAVALLVEPLGSGLVLVGQSREIYEWLLEYRVWIVTVGLTVALVDLLFARNSSHRSSKH